MRCKKSNAPFEMLSVIRVAVQSFGDVMVMMYILC